MQSLAREKFETIADELGVFGVNRPLSDFGAAVAFVVEEGMADVVHMDANLMRASGLQNALDHCHKAESLNYLVMCDCVLSVVSVRENPEFHPVGRVAADVADYRSLIFADVAPNYCNIFSFNGMDEKLFGKVKLCFVIFCHHQQSGCILVNPVHKHTHSFIFGVRALRNAEVVGEGVNECAVEMPVTRVHNHSGRFVYHKDVIVFINYVKRNIFRQNLKSAPLIWHHELNYIPRLDDAVRLCDSFVYADIFLLYCKLNTVS